MTKPWPPDRKYLDGVVTHEEQVELLHYSDAELAALTSMWLKSVLQDMDPREREYEMAPLTRPVLLECARRYGPK